MASKTPSTRPPVQSNPTYQHGSRLPLYLLRHGCGLVGFGLLFGFVVPMTPYPRLALTAHIQFAVEGTLILAAGLLLQSDPFNGGRPNISMGTESSSPNRVQLADRLGYWQKRVIYWSMASTWITLLSEAANAWWGTKMVLPLAFEAAGLRGDSPAAFWMEAVVAVAHWPGALGLATVWPTLLSSLW